MRGPGFLNSDVHKAFNPLFLRARFLDERDFDEELGRNARLHIRGYPERINARLAGRDWLTARRSLADTYLFVVLQWVAAKQVNLDGLDQLAAFSAQLHADLDGRAALAFEAN